MRSVPSRLSLRASLGFTPADGKLEDRITSLKRFSPLAGAYENKPLDVGWEKKIQSYADAVWGAIRVLQDAAKVQRRVYTLTGYTDVPENAVPYEETMKRILDQFSPDSSGVQGSIQKGEKGPGWVTWKTLPFLSTLLNAGGLFGTAKGDGPKFENAKKSKDALLKQIDQIRAQLGENLVRSMKVDEPVTKAVERWQAEDAAPAPSASSQEMLPSLTRSDAEQTAEPGRTEPGMGLPTPSPEGTPPWLVPALVAATAAGVALLVLPTGSSNRGSRARNLDYGSVTSDAHEGRMLRGTLRNLESDAHAMRQMLEDDDDLPQWVHSKVETSADRVNSAHRYLRAKIQSR